MPRTRRKDRRNEQAARRINKPEERCISRGGATAPAASKAQQARVAAATSKLRRAIADFTPSSRLAIEADAHYLATYGLRTVKGGNDVRALLKNGLRVKAVATVQPDRAWVWLQGRNNDGSTYQFSSLWRRRGSAWREAVIVAADRHDLPSTFPPPLPLWNMGLQLAFKITTDYVTIAMTCDDPNGIDDAEFLTRQAEDVADMVTQRARDPDDDRYSATDWPNLNYLEVFDSAAQD